MQHYMKCEPFEPKAINAIPRTVDAKTKQTLYNVNVSAWQEL